MLIKLIERVQRRETRILLRISLICAFRIFSRFRMAFDGRRSTQAWLQNLAPFQVFINTFSLGPVYEFVCISFRTDNLNCFRVS